ncbi:MAG: SRPBCC family protein [Actinomycetota bacterium]
MVKYADAPQAEAEVSIDAAPGAVWPLVTDISLPAQFTAEFQGADWVDDGPALGATFHGHNKHQFVGEWTTTCTVTAFEDGSVFEWTVGDVENKTARWRFDLAPSETGSSLRFSAEMGPGPSGLTMAIQQMPDREEEIVANRLAEWTGNMQATLDGIKGLAET